MTFGLGKQILRLLALAGALSAIPLSSLRAQTEPPAGASRPGGDASETAPVTVGINGHYRVGSWTAVRWPEAAGRTADDRVSIETLDGDGTRVIYRQPREGFTAAQRGARRGYAIAGSEAAPLVIRDESNVLISTRFPERGSPSRGPAMVPLGMPWIVALGDPMGIDQIGVNELLDRGASVAVSQPRRAVALPDSVLGYDGVDLLVINSSGRALLGALNEKQSGAIVDWVLGGGQLLITLGESAPALLETAPWLYRLLPLSAEELVISTMNPSGLETFTSSQTRLEPFAGVELPREAGWTLVTGRTTRRVSVPLAARYHAGFGQVTAIAADLENPPLADWPERMALITRLTGTLLESAEQRRLSARRTTGFNDLAGQMRATLDRFEVKRSVPFSVIALIVIGWIAVIGPLDYWVLNRVLGRPLLGWLSFPLMAIGLSVLLVFAARPATPAEGQPGDREATAVRYNRVEVVDIDTAENVGRGFAWSHLYSHPARRVAMDVSGGEVLRRVSERVDMMLTTPLGFADAAFGGIEIAGEDARLPPYTVAMRDGTTLRGTIEGLPLAPRSSKSLATRYRFQPQLSAENVIERRPGSELLQGELVNPLPVDLLDGMLIYRNWVYLLPTRFPAGGRIASLDSLRQKNFRWQLTRQKALESATETEAWDAAQYDAPGRVMEMLMFHQAAGGTRYTGLRHEPLSFLDLSDLLSDDRCLLVGRLAEPATEVQLSEASGSGLADASSEAGADTLTMIRVMLPVQTVRSP